MQLKTGFRLLFTFIVGSYFVWQYVKMVTRSLRKISHVKYTFRHLENHNVTLREVTELNEAAIFTHVKKNKVTSEPEVSLFLDI